MLAARDDLDQMVSDPDGIGPTEIPSQTKCAKDTQVFGTSRMTERFLSGRPVVRSEYLGLFVISDKQYQGMSGCASRR
jgi:hypothetical protein